MSTETGAGSYVVVNQLTIDTDGDALEETFSQRLGRVEGAVGSPRLEAWRNTASASGDAMVSWWDTETDLRAYSGSHAHRRSHARILREAHAPHATALHRYEVIAR